MQGRSAILTGASYGLGRQIARALSARGVRLALVARSQAQLQELSAELDRPDCPCLPLVADLAEPQAAQRVSEQASRQLGAIDFLVNNAALEGGGRFLSQSAEQMQQQLQVNLVAPLQLTRQLLPSMLERGFGQIVTVASLAGKIATPYAASYAASKAGLMVWSKSLHLELEGTGVGSSVVTPGFVSEVGMYSWHQTRPPWFLRAATPDMVVGAVLEALEKNPIELLVSGSPFRPLEVLHAAFPRLFIRSFRRFGMVDYLRRSYTSATEARKAKGEQ